MNLFINLMFYGALPLGVLFAVGLIIAHFCGNRILNRIYRDEAKHSFDEKYIKNNWGNAD